MAANDSPMTISHLPPNAKLYCRWDSIQSAHQKNPSYCHCCKTYHLQILVSPPSTKRLLLDDQHKLLSEQAMVKILCEIVIGLAATADRSLTCRTFEGATVATRRGFTA